MDCIMIDNTDSDFVIENENSGKYLEIKKRIDNGKCGCRTMGGYK